MERVLIPFFWFGLIAAIGAATVLPPGALRWVAIAIIAVAGAFFSGTNWYVILRGTGSLVPPFGAVLFVLAVAAVPVGRMRWWRRPLRSSIRGWS